MSQPTMPKPFRLYGASSSNATKVLLIQSDLLFLAIPANRVQEVLVKVEIVRHQNHSFTSYKGDQIPTIFGAMPSPSQAQTTVALLYAEILKSGFLAIACNHLPQLASISPEDWQASDPLPQIWQSEPRGYTANGQIYIFSTGIRKLDKKLSIPTR
jgi:hypothetical protein